jgi:hypothetical protein
MTWTCPDCQREFRNTNQWHSCIKADVADHLRDKSAAVVAAFDKLSRGIEGFGEMTISPVKTAIQFKAGATFLSVKIKKDYVELEFQLGELVERFPVYRSVRVSKNRVVHLVVIEGPEGVDKQLMGWLRASYVLVSGKEKGE